MSSPRLLIVEYGVGNIGSVAHACRRAGIEPHVVHEGSEIAQVKPSHIVLPGVGAIGEALMHLRSRGFENPLRQLALVDRLPILAICVGMQMLAEHCHEFGEHRGLGWLPHAVTNRMADRASGMRLPHVGWNTVADDGDPLFQGLRDRHFYFVHSYVIQCAAEFVAARTEYEGRTFISAVRRDNIVGVQFHPEKSSSAGAQLIKNFLAQDA